MIARECFGQFAHLFQRRTRSVIHDGEMLLVVIQVIKREHPKEQNNSSVEGLCVSSAACEGRAAPVGEAQPEHVVAVEPQRLHRAQQHHVAHVELHLPHVLALKQHRLLDVLAHHLQHSTARGLTLSHCLFPSTASDSIKRGKQPINSITMNMHKQVTHVLDAALVGDLSVEGDAHEVGHPVQQAGHLAQLLPRVLRAERPGVVHEEYAAGELGWHHSPVASKG
ncbi:hypothetical protein EK904_004460 [Melospiza melodia maxima]|nr:hypothetical protein EK904_004460 [Melospiza melodia maxima]